MDKSPTLAETQQLLTLVMSFFPRVDAKASVVLAVNTGMLAVLSSDAPHLRSVLWWEWTFIGITITLLGASSWFLYRTAFPRLEGGQQSLIYFREIAARTENHFIQSYRQQSEDDYLADLLGQIWRNSEILKMKFDALRWSFLTMAIAILPWAASVALLTSHRN